MKLLLVNSVYAPQTFGGAEVVVRGIAEAVGAYQIEPVVVTISPDDDQGAYHHNGVRVRRLRLHNSYYPWPSIDRNPLVKALWHARDMVNKNSAAAFGKLLDEEQPDLVHTHVLSGLSVSIWAEVKRRRIPLVHTVHDYYLMCVSSSMFTGGRNCRTRCGLCRVYRHRHARISRHVDIAVGVSQFVLDRHRAGGIFKSPTRSVVIHNGFDGPKSAPRSAPRTGPVRFGFLGNLAPYKGIELLLKTITGLDREGWILKVGGSGNEGYESFLKNTFSHPRIEFLGYTDRDEFYRSIDVMIAPAIWQEPAGLTIVEGHANGRPLICAKRGGMPENVDHGETGFIFEPDRPRELADAIARFIDEPALASRMSKRCLENAKDRSIKSKLENYVGVYRGLVSSDKRTLAGLAT